MARSPTAVDAAARPRLGRRVSAFFRRHRRQWPVAALLALPVAWLVGVYLGSLVVLLVASFWQTDPFTSEGRAHVHARQLPHPVGARRLPERRLAHDPDGGDGHRRRRGARVPDRVLHGASRVAADTRDPDRRGRDAALGQLPREGLRLADDARARGRVELGARPARAGRPRATRNRALARVHLPLAAVHDPARSTQGSSGSRIRSSRRRRISARGRCTRSSASSCRSRSRRSSPARSSRSRSRSATTSRPG